MDDVEKYLLTIFQINNSVTYDFDDLETFINKIEELIKKEGRHHDVYAKNMLVDANEEEREILSDILGEEGWLLGKELPDFIRSSILVACFSKFEYNLLFICRYLKAKHHLIKNPDDIKGDNYLDKYKKYIKKEALINFPDQSKHWEAIISINKIRNLFVHNQGELYKDYYHYETVKKFIKNNPGLLSLNDRNYILLKEHFLLYVIDIIREFFMDFFNSWREWVRMNKKEK